MPVGNHYLDKESQENFEGYFDLLINQLNYFIFSKLFGGVENWVISVYVLQFDARVIRERT